MNKSAKVASGVVGLVALGAVSLAMMRQPPAEEIYGPEDGGPIEQAVADSFEQVASWDADIGPFDKVLGDPDAPLTIVEYASFTCGHCADFHEETLPALKEAYIDTGAVRFVFRDFPLDGLALRAGMLARCGRDDQYFGLVDAIFASQDQWIRDDEPMAALQRLGSLAGIGAEQFEACMADEDLSNSIIELRLEAQERYNIRATPSFVIDGEVHSGHLRFNEFAEMIDARLPERLTD